VNGSEAYRIATIVFSTIIVLVGLATLISGPFRDAGPVTYVIGAVFVGFGAARLWLTRAGRR
jgi:hypothetical protein